MRHCGLERVAHDEDEDDATCLAPLGGANLEPCSVGVVVAKAPNLEIY